MCRENKNLLFRKAYANKKDLRAPYPMNFFFLLHFYLVEKMNTGLYYQLLVHRISSGCNAVRYHSVVCCVSNELFRKENEWCKWYINSFAVTHSENLWLIYTHSVKLHKSKTETKQADELSQRQAEWEPWAWLLFCALKRSSGGRAPRTLGSWTTTPSIDFLSQEMQKSKLAPKFS